MATKTSVAIDAEEVTRRILIIRGHRVLLDSELASPYHVATNTGTRAVRRNADRFPADFTSQRTAQEAISRRSQNGTLKGGRGQHREYAPYVCTEQGVVMLAAVLDSKRAVQINHGIMRAFVPPRHAVSTHAGLARKLMTLEKRYDEQFKVVVDALRGLLREPVPRRRGIGFTASIDD